MAINGHCMAINGSFLIPAWPRTVRRSSTVEENLQTSQQPVEEAWPAKAALDRLWRAQSGLRVHLMALWDECLLDFRWRLL